MKNDSIEYALLVLENYIQTKNLPVKRKLITDCHFYIFSLLETQITFMQQLYIEKKPITIYNYTGMHLCLNLGKVEHSELWVIKPISSAPTIIIYSKS